jgi:DNA-3-methyladenine glycosylase I
MTFPYQRAFQLAEEALIRYGSNQRPFDEIRTELDDYKTFAGRELTDQLCFSILVHVVFYSGFRAATVTARMSVIDRWFPDWRTVSDYTQDDVAAIMADPGMIRNRRKIAACIANARVIRQLIGDHGSFAQYIKSFEPTSSFENLLLLKEELEARFQYLGGITVYHFLTDIGMPVLKPDRVICRIFQRLGLTETESQLLKTVLQGRKFAEATGLPIRYIDIVFVAYGQVRSTEFGIDRGICLSDPRCSVCGLTELCRWYHENKAPTDAKLDPGEHA